MKHNGYKVIDKAQLEKNLDEIKKITKSKKICAMVKADAYGHGLQDISKFLVNKVDFFGVSNINEALFVRQISDSAKILIVGKTLSFEECIENDFSFIIDSIDHFKKLIDYCRSNVSKISDKCINIHIKVNVGMNRLGVKSLEEFKEIYQTAKLMGIKVEGIATHFATAECDPVVLKKHVDIFSKFLNLVPKDEDPIINVGGSFVLSDFNQQIFENLNFNMIRVGIAMYGYCAEKISKKIKPILKIESKIIKILDVKNGEYIGYCKGFQAEKDMRIGIVPLGYGDGIPRNLSNQIQVEIISRNSCSKRHIYKCAIVGNICMDMFFVDLCNNADAKEDDKVIVARNIKKWAKILKVIPYEVLTNFGLLR